jgi:hypothetical protein
VRAALEYSPAPHTMHWVMPVTGATEPPAHGVHEVALAASDTVPAGHITPVLEVICWPQKEPGADEHTPAAPPTHTGGHIHMQRTK